MKITRFALLALVLGSLLWMTTASGQLNCSGGNFNCTDPGFLFWDLTNHRMGIGTTTPQGRFVVSNGGALGLEVPTPTGTSITIQAFNRMSSAYGNLELDAATVTLAPQGAAANLALAPVSGMVAFTVPIVFASLPSPSNGTMIYCSDCKPTTAFVNSTCAGGGTGALALRLNGIWACEQ